VPAFLATVTTIELKGLASVPGSWAARNSSARQFAAPNRGRTLRRRRVCLFVVAAMLVMATRTSTAQSAETMRRLSKVPAPVGPAGMARDLYSNSYALLVGVSRYDVASAWQSLDSIGRELTEVKAALSEVGFSSVERIDNPTGDELRQAVQKFIGRYGYEPTNRLLFYFSGHGFTLDEGRRGYFVPRDAPDPRTNESGFRQVALTMDQVALWARDITVRHALFAFDSCFSGTIFRTRDRPVPTAISERTAKKVRMFLSAGDADQPVPARSVFTPTFIRGLRGEADLDHDGFVTGTELGNWVQGKVIEYQTYQTPQFGRLHDTEFDEGDIVFATIGGPATAVSSVPDGGGANTLPKLPAARAIAPTASTVKQIRVFVSAASSQAGLINSDAASVQDSVRDVRESILDKRKESLQVVERPEDADVQIEVTKRLTRGTTAKASPGGRNSPYIELCVVQATLVAGDHQEDIEGTVSDRYRLGAVWRIAANDLTGQVEKFAKNNHDALISRRAR